jgi:hypothetical protein
MYDKLKLFYNEVNNHSDLTYKSIPFFNQIVRDIKVELLKISTQQGEQISRDVTDAMRLIGISEREDLSGIQNYPREIPKYLARIKTVILSTLAFATKQNKKSKR